MTAELDWHHTVEDIPDAGMKVERDASEQERQAIAAALDLLSCPSLTVRYAIVPRGEGHYRVTGSLQATVEQACVVTLEPLTNAVAENFSVDYWPETDIPTPSGGVLDVHDEPDLEPIVAGRLEVGWVVFECLASGIDLFPRKPGVTFESPLAPQGGNGDTAGGPFAALAKMKSKR